MYNFTFQNPTKLIFGKDTIGLIQTEIPKDKNILITFGGGSVRKNGVYNTVIEALKDHSYTEFWGIEPNPTVQTIRKAVTLGKERGCDFVLAVGGGSVVDASKLIAVAIVNEHDPWDIVKKIAPFSSSLPLAAVLTLPATGSEMNSGAVISNSDTKEKFSFLSYFPIFSILDPQVTFSLPDYQIACGIADSFIHTMEQYLTTTGQSPLMDRWAEGILLTLIEIAPKILENKHDYDTMSTFMICATTALNGFISMGVNQDWATHVIGHELTALTGITHGHTLAIVFPGTMRIMKDEKRKKILQYGERIWGINTLCEEEAIEQTIAKTELFFRSLGLMIKLSENGVGEEVITEVVKRFDERMIKFGENRTVDAIATKAILESVLK